MARYPRGKPTTPARPGKIIKEVLSGKRPLVSGDLVTEAAITDISAVYRDFIYEQNLTRKQGSKLKGMVYSSFLKVFKFAQLLGLVELVREEPMLFPPGNKHLYSVRKRHIEGDGNRINATISKRRIFKLSQLGIDDELSWTDLCRAWREGWSAPQKVIVPIKPEKKPLPELIITTGPEEHPPLEEEERIEYIPRPRGRPKKEALPGEVVAETAVKRPRGRPKKVVVGVVEEVKVEAVKKEEVVLPAFTLSVKPSKEQYQLLYDRLIVLKEAGVASKNVQKELTKLAAVVGDWTATAVEMYETAQTRGVPKEVIAARALRTILYNVDEGLLDKNIDKAMEQLKRLL